LQHLATKISKNENAENVRFEKKQKIRNFCACLVSVSSPPPETTLKLHSASVLEAGQQSFQHALSEPRIKYRHAAERAYPSEAKCDQGKVAIDCDTVLKCIS